MKAAIAGVLSVAMLANAPLQCGHSSDPNLRHEDDAGDALWSLAMDFRAKGNEQAARQTLEFLVQKYPSNRHVPAAKEDLASAK
jgi:TolA-binding protein